MHDAKQVMLNQEELSLDTIEQSYLVIQEKEKFKHLCNFIKKRDKKQTIVCCCYQTKNKKTCKRTKTRGF